MREWFPNRDSNMSVTCTYLIPSKHIARYAVREGADWSLERLARETPLRFGKYEINIPVRTWKDYRKTEVLSKNTHTSEQVE